MTICTWRGQCVNHTAEMVERKASYQKYPLEAARKDVGVTYKIHTYALGSEGGIHPAVVEASSDLRSFWCKKLDDQASRRMVLKSN